MDLTSEQFAQRAFQCNLLDERQIEQVWSHFGRHDVEPEEFRGHLVRQGLLTNYQVERLLKGEKSGYFYGDYKVLYLVGAGTFARVYRAVHKDTGKVVAVKVLRNRHADNAKIKEQFLREGQMGVSLRHPGIVAIYDVHTQGKTSYLVMDFVEGQSLREFIKIRKKFEPAEATRLVSEIVGGLAHAFSKGITHRDLRMANVLVSSAGKAMLVDFGLAAADARLTDEAIASFPNPRTIDYAALERATGVRKDDPRSDIYFVGCIFYHLLTGKAPLYESRDRLQRLNLQRFQEIPPILQLEPTLPPAVSMVVNRAMDLNPNKRYQTPIEMLGDLRVLSKRLAAGETGAEKQAESTDFALNATASSALPSLQKSRSVMLVESDAGMQNMLRDALKKQGYRVLVTGDPERALSRFEGETPAAECVVFSAIQLGEAAVKAAQRFATFVRTCNLPLLLLLPERHPEWQAEIPPGPHRLSLVMPIKVGQFRDAIKKILDANTVAAGE